MLVNVSPASNLERMTTNALRYGQLFAAGRKGGGGAAAAAAAAAVTAATKPSALSSAAGVVKPWMKEKKVVSEETPVEALPAMLEELRALYAKHCPEKSADEVDVILLRFAGREAELLAKVKAKYSVG
eukprot:UN4311